MTPAGQNYPIAEHSVVFWVGYLAVAITVTMLLMGLFLLMVSRASNTTRADLEGAVEPSPELDAGTAAGALGHGTAA